MIRYWKNFLFFQKNNKKTGSKYDNKKRFTKTLPLFLSDIFTCKTYDTVWVLILYIRKRKRMYMGTTLTENEGKESGARCRFEDQGNIKSIWRESKGSVPTRTEGLFLFPVSFFYTRIDWYMHIWKGQEHSRVWSSRRKRICTLDYGRHSLSL